MDISKPKKTYELNRKLYTPQVDNFKNTQHHFYQYFNLKTAANQSRKGSITNNLKTKEPRKPSKDVLGPDGAKKGSRMTLSITPTSRERKKMTNQDKLKPSTIKNADVISKVNLKKLIDKRPLHSKQSTLTKTLNEEKLLKNASKVITGKVTPLLQKQFKTSCTKPKSSLKGTFMGCETLYDKIGFYNSKSNKEAPSSSRMFSKTFREQNKENVASTNKLKTETCEEEPKSISNITNKRYSLMFSNFFKKKEEGVKHAKIPTLVTEPQSIVFMKFDEKADFHCLFAFYDYLKAVNESIDTDESAQFLALLEVVDKDALAQFVSRINLEEPIGDELVCYLKTVIIFFVVVVGISGPKSPKFDLSAIYALMQQIFEYLLYYLNYHLSMKKPTKATEQFSRWIKDSELDENFKVHEVTILALKNANQMLYGQVNHCIKVLFDQEKQKVIGDLLKDTRNYSFGDIVLKASEVYETFSCSYLLSESTVSLSMQRDPDASMTNIFDDDEEPYFIVQPFDIKTYLPPKDPNTGRYTLVLDLDETLVHFQETEAGGQFLVRPFAQEFLELMSEKFELVVFTAAVQEYADWIIDRIDNKGLVKHRLYREHTKYQDDAYIKDLSKIGRELSKTIIIDNNADNFKLQPENGIYIKSWYDNPQDQALRQLSKVLLKLVEVEPVDIRVALQTLQRRMTNGNRTNAE